MRTLLDLQIARDLNRDSGLSEADYDVLSTLSEKPEGRWRARHLAAQVPWATLAAAVPPAPRPPPYGSAGCGQRAGGRSGHAGRFAGSRLVAMQRSYATTGRDPRHSRQLKHPAASRPAATTSIT